MTAEGGPRKLERHALDEVAATPVLLVACDYDGTLAPIVDDPTSALPMRESIVGLRSLATLPDTHVAVISGRSLRDLATLSRLPPEVHLIGSHGSEFDPGFVNALPPTVRETRGQLILELEAIARRYAGASVEVKPAGAAFHYRLIGEGADDAVAEVLDGPATIDGVSVKLGKMVIELSAVATDKGTALERIRQHVGATAAIFIGDDVTDEDAFERLTGPDLGIKVGPGDSVAHMQIDDPEAVARLLATLFERRHAWLQGDNAPPIERHTLLSDQRTLALLTPDARVTWLCHPRADSPSVFAELLGGPSAGWFSVRPDPDKMPLGQRYVDESFVVETRWAGLRLTDYLDVSHGRPYEPPGRTDLVRVLEGEGPVVVEFAPRLDFGRAPTRLEVGPEGAAVLGSPESMVLVAPGHDWQLVDDGVHARAVARIRLTRGEPVVLELRLGGDAHRDHLSEPERRRGTREHWSRWASTLQPPPVASSLVRRSALVLKALCHQPTGAILAAGTTSLPEVVGGVRNWDYRYCWPRDAAIAADALVRIGSTQEALAFLDWLLARAAPLHSIDSLRPLYPLAGDEFLPEAVIPTLNGYRGSRPVRIGNLAEHQLQLDMFGPIAQLIQRLCERGTGISDRVWELMRALVEAVGRRWSEPDHGIWELRRAPQHHVHSRLMCWVTVDRGISVAHLSGRATPKGWSQLRAAIADDVLTHGWSESLHSFTNVYGEDEVDAAVLAIATCGILPADDARVAATVARIEHELRRGQVVDRYRYDDGLPGREGGFLICTTWLIEALVAAGRGDDARQLFARYLDLAGPTGMLAEQYEPDFEMTLGNVPQAYSHAGLISAALAVASLGSR